MGKIAIIGSGLIGCSWAMLFASGGHDVTLFDVIQAQLDAAQRGISEQIRTYEKSGKLRGNLSADEQLRLIHFTDDLVECVQGAMYVQECVPEVLELKKKVFTQLDTVANDNMILASSSTAIPASKFTEEMKFRHRAIIAHPVNPPYFMPLVELVPAPWTHPDVVTATRQLLKDIGQSPVTLKKEIMGFVQPRIQYAIIQECLRLVTDDVISAEDIDKIFTSGLGLRYSFVGPFESIHLNAEGVENYLERYADMIHGIVLDEGPPMKLEDNPKMETVYQQMDARVPLDQLAERRKWRDERIAALSQLKLDLNKEDNNENIC